MRRLFLILAIISLFLVGCSDEESVHSTPIFKVETIDIPDGLSVMTTLLDATEGSVTVRLCDEYIPGVTTEQKLYSMTYTHADGKSSVTELEKSTHRLLASAKTEHGRLEVTGVLGDMNYDSVTLTEYEGDSAVREYGCGELFETDLSSLRAAMGDNGDIFTVHALARQGKEIIIVANIGVVSVSDGDMKRLYLAESPIKSAAFSDGRLIVISDRARYFDLESFTEDDELTLPDGFESENFFALDGYELALRDADGIHGFVRGEDGELVHELVCDFARSDINADAIMLFASASASEFYIIEYDRYLYQSSLLRLTPRNQSASERTELTIALLPTDSQEIRAAVTEFNRRSDNYRFIVKVYGGSWDDTEINVEAAKLELMSDITNGKIPDMLWIAVHFGIDADSFEQMGYFADIYALMESSGYDKSSILSCQLESFTRMNPTDSGEYLPYLALEAHAKTLVSDPDVFDGRLTLEKYAEILSGDRKPLQFFGRYTTFSDIIALDLERFIDSDGKTSFDSELFRKLIERSRNLPEYDDQAAIFKSVDLTAVSRLTRQYPAEGIERINIAGYPDSDGNGVELVPATVIGIGEKSAHKDAAFELVRILLSDKYRLGMNPLNTPLTTVSSFEAYFATVNRYYLLLDKGGMAISDKPFTDEKIAELGGGKQIVISDEFIADIREGILSARTRDRIAPKLLAMIYEEVSSAHRTPEEVAVIINDRAEIIYNESK